MKYKKRYILASRPCFRGPGKHVETHVRIVQGTRRQEVKDAGHKQEVEVEKRFILVSKLYNNGIQTAIPKI